MSLTVNIVPRQPLSIPEQAKHHLTRLHKGECTALSLYNFAYELIYKDYAELSQQFCAALCVAHGQPSTLDILHAHSYAYVLQHNQAIALYEQIIEDAVLFNPNDKVGYRNAYYNLGCLYLLEGQLAKGFPLFEERLKKPENLAWFKPFEKKLLPANTSIVNKRILLIAEQGFGDTIQMLRFVPAVMAMCAETALRAPVSLHKICRQLFPQLPLLSSQDVAFDYDYSLSLMSLPAYFKLSDTAMLAKHPSPYITVKADDKATWYTKLHLNRQYKHIGVVWSGASHYGNDHIRSLQLTDLAPLFEVNPEHIQWHSLHVAYRGDDHNLLANYGIVDHAPQLHDFYDTACLIDQLDMVIAVDTSVAHLAGALAKPTWLLVPYTPDWRWMRHNEHTAWYPYHTLYRQHSKYNWQEVITRVCTALQSQFLLPE